MESIAGGVDERDRGAHLLRIRAKQECLHKKRNRNAHTTDTNTCICFDLFVPNTVITYRQEKVNKY